MALTRLSLRRPLTMLMIILALVVMGYRAYTFLQLDRFPKVDFPIVSVVTVFPGASPEDIEELVVKPIEDAVAGISGIDRLTSRSTEGVGSVIIEFTEGTDGNTAAIDVERQISTVQGQLPPESEDPTVIKADINAIPVLVLALSGPQSQAVLFDWADTIIKPRLQSVPGVASVNISGGREREVHVFVNPEKLAGFGLSLGDVERALAANNVTFPAGSIDEGRQKISVRSVGEFSNLEEIRNLVVHERGESDRPGDQSGSIYLRDVATIEMGLEDQEDVLRYNGSEAVSLNVVKTSEGNTVEVVDEAITTIEELNQDLPVGAELSVVLDNSDFIRESVAAVLEDLVLAVIITGLVMLVFLHTIRSTFIVLLAIPTSIISTFLVMWMLGFSLNQLTLLALTLVIGILVDDSIVVIENIERHLEMKKPPYQAALDGRTEIGLAAITITLVDVVVYLPVAFTSGILGQFFFSYGVTIAVAALFSLFVAFTLTPMLAAQWMKDQSKPETEPKGLRKFFSVIFKPVGWLWHRLIRSWEWGFEQLARFYAMLLRFFLWNFATQILAVILATIALAGGIYLVVSGAVGSEFLPQEDDGQIRVSIEMPPGTNLDTTDEVAKQVELIALNQLPNQVSAILSRVGAGGGGGIIGGTTVSNEATINLVLVDRSERDITTSEAIDILRPYMAKIPEANISLILASSAGGGPGSPIQVQLSGTDKDTLIELANQVEEVIRSVPGAADIVNTDAARAPETRLVVDRNQAVDLNLSPAQVATTLRTALSGNDIGEYQPPGETEVNIVLRLEESAREDFNQLLQIPMTYINNQPVKLERVVNMERTLAPARITRADRQRVLTVGSGTDAGATLGDVTNDVEAAIEEQIDFPVGYDYKFIGSAEMQRESFAELGSSILLGIVLIYMLLVALYQSWLHPLAIMFSLPVTLVGAFGGLYLTGNTLNLISMLGIVLLTGVVTKNAVLIVDFTNNLREEEGYERKEALIAAGRMRLRAVLMTTLTLVFALLPLLLGAGAGSENRAPLAAVVIGGTISSTLLTLILVPVVYNFLDWLGIFTTNLFRKLVGSTPPPGDEPPPSGQSSGKDEQSSRSPVRPSPQPTAPITMNKPDPDTA